MTVLVTNIKYDTDGQVVRLPKKLFIEVPKDIVDEQEITDFVSDEISNKTGFCHYGFEMKYGQN